MHDNCLGTVPLKKVKAAIKSLESKCPEEKELSISFEYLIGSFFPQVLDNIHTLIKDSYIEGFNEGKKIKEETND